MEQDLPEPGAVARALDLQAIERLQRRYGDVVTRRAWGELDELFAPGCPVRLDLRGRVVELCGAPELASFLGTAMARFELLVLTVQNTVVDLAEDPDRAVGRLYIQELRQEVGGRWTVAVGLYQDVYERRAGRWCFARRDYATLARSAPSGDGMEAFPVPGGAG